MAMIIIISEKYYPLRAFPENLKRFSSKFTNIMDVRINACNQVWNLASIMALTCIMTSEGWSLFVCWLFCAQHKKLVKCVISVICQCKWSNMNSYFLGRIKGIQRGPLNFKQPCRCYDLILSKTTSGRHYLQYM